MRNIRLTAVALLGAALLAPVGTATAAGETCQGQAATIVGTPGGQITGTEGADVIVTNGATRVDALGGDDLVCATSEDPKFSSSGAGAILGAGADTFIDSSGGGHYIYAGTVDGTDTEADVIRAGNGDVNSGMVGQPNADIIDLAFGEVSWSGIQTAPGALSVDSGGILGVRSANDDVTMDASGTVTGVDTMLTWTGQFDRLVFTTSAEHGRFTFRGTSGTEHVKVDAPTTYERDIALGGGKDSYESNTLGGKATRIKGGSGRNQLLLELGSHDRVRADLSRSRVTATKAGVKDSIRVRGFDDLIVTAKRADVIGTNRANRIGVIACRTTIKGTKGRDDLYADSQYRGLGTWTTPRCGTYKATIYGGPGNDTITGSIGNDRLIGGPGKDIVMGRSGGFDVCQGEKLRECEKRI
jgi:RTX calcium-binding nonapeptide repeat (4 copies)